MKPFDLTIGNIVSLSENDIEIIPCKVVGLWEDDLCVKRPNDIAYDVVGYDMIRPIYITEEILENNGWVHDTILKNWWHAKVEPVIFYTDKGKYYCNAITSIELNCVHQLQNFLNMCGYSDLAKKFVI